MIELTNTIIVDDHPAFRQALRQFVQTFPSLEVVGEAVDGRDGIKKMTTLKSKLVLMDICMPQTNGVEACRAMKLDDLAPLVVLYSANPFEVESARNEQVADLCVEKERLFDDLPDWIRDTFHLPAKL